MAIQIGPYTFEGPYAHTCLLADRSGVYAVLTLDWSNQYEVVDVGESAMVRTRVESHDRSSCWKRNEQRGLSYAVLYTRGLHQEGRREIEQKLRALFRPACGVR